jgi:hypothetical protein
MRTSRARVAPVMLFSTVLVAVACNKQEAAPPPPPVAHVVDAAVATGERVPDAATPVPAKTTRAVR